MLYLCLAYGDESKSNTLSQQEMDALIGRCRTYDAELQATGRVVSAMSLGWAATTLRPRTGKLSITDGPFAETKEVVGGLVVIEADDLDEAIRVASLHPAARMGEELGWGVEVRPVEECLARRPEGSSAG
jgi:hypothetical protein